MIRWETRDRVGIATIDRPERRNALSADLCGQLVEQLTSTPSLRAIVIAGASGTFCAGADLGTRFDDDPSQGGDTFRPAFDAALDAIVDSPAPVIAAIEGPALGAGVQLAVACDLRVAARDATLAVPAGRLGVHLSALNIARLAHVAGHGLARDLLVGGRVLRGDEAHACGLVQRLAEDPRAAALEWAEELATLAPLTLAGHKRALNLLVESSYSPDARTDVDELERRAFDSEDLREGMTAFAEKRPARFQGR